MPQCQAAGGHDPLGHSPELSRTSSVSAQSSLDRADPLSMVVYTPQGQITGVTRLDRGTSTDAKTEFLLLPPELGG